MGTEAEAQAESEAEAEAGNGRRKPGRTHVPKQVGHDVTRDL